MDQKRYNDFNSYLKNKFGFRVQKITVDAGLTCPNRDGASGTGGCIYCSSKGSGTGEYPLMSITEQIESSKKKIIRRYKADKFIAYFQSYSNTYAPVEILSKIYEEALAVKDIVGLSIGTRPDCLGEGVLDLLDVINTKTSLTVEYGVQSAHDRTLKLINRGHSFGVFKEAVENTRERGIDVCAHVILGLPGEDENDMLETARILGGMDIQFLKIHLLYVINGTVLHEMYKKGVFECFTRDKYVDILCKFLTYIPENVVVQRLTGDPHPEDLIAPEWALEKNATLAAIEKKLENEDLYQGKNV